MLALTKNEAMPEVHSVALLERLLLPFAQPHHRRHVHLVEGGEHGRAVVLRFDRGRRAMSRACLVMRTRVSPGSSRPGGASAGAGLAARGRRRGGVTRPRRGAIAACTSCFITRRRCPTCTLSRFTS
jgi:hypothetical protein